MTDTDQTRNRTRRSILLFALEKAAIPAGIGLFGVWIGARVNERYEDRHAVSITIIRSDNATPREDIAEDPFDVFAPSVPTPTPDPDPQYTYTVLVRNNGDFPEENVVIAVAMKGSDPPPQMLSLGFDASSSLVSQMIQAMPPIDPPPSFTMAIRRLNPEEWASLKTSWDQSMQVSVQARSDHVSESASS